MYTIYIRVTVAPSNFSNDILGRIIWTLLTRNCLEGFNISITKDCPGRQLSRDREINKKHLQEHQKFSNENIRILPPVRISAGVVTFWTVASTNPQEGTHFERSLRRIRRSGHILNGRSNGSAGAVTFWTVTPADLQERFLKSAGVVRSKQWPLLY